MRQIFFDFPKKNEPKGCWNCRFARIAGVRPHYKPGAGYLAKCLLEPDQGTIMRYMTAEKPDLENCKNHMPLMKGQK